MAEHKFHGVVGPFLGPDEHIEAAAIGSLGQPSAKRQVATAAAVSVLTLGTFTGFATAKGLAFVLTNHRLLIFDTNLNATKPAGEPRAEIDRHGLKVVSTKSLVSMKVDLMAADGSEIGLAFAAIQRKAAKGLVEAIAASPPAPAPAVAQPTTKRAAPKKTAATKKAAPKKAAAKKAAAKKAAAKKAAAKKSPPKTQGKGK